MFDCVPEPGLEHDERELVVERAVDHVLRGAHRSARPCRRRARRARAFARAAACLTRPNARMTGRPQRKRATPIGKLSIERCVCAPHRRAACTRTSPSASRSRRVADMPRCYTAAFVRRRSAPSRAARSSALRWSGSRRRARRLGRGDSRRVPAVRVAVQLEPEPGGGFDDLRTHGGCVLADAAGEHERVEAAQRRGERAELAPDPVAEQVDGELRARIVARRAACACRSRCRTRRAVPTRGRAAARWRARPCRARPSGTARRRGRGRRLRVPIIRPSTAVKPIVEATLRPSLHRAHRRPVAEMRDDDAAARRARIDAGQRVRDVLVGEAVEAVAAHAPVGDRRGSANACVTPGCAAVERRCRSRRPAARRARPSRSPRIGARLCGWCSGASGTSVSRSLSTSSFTTHRRRVPRRRRARRGGRRRTGFGPPAFAQEAQQVVHAGTVRGAIRASAQWCAAITLPASSFASKFALGVPRPSICPRQLERELAVAQREQRELEARRSGVEDCNAIAHVVPTPAASASSSRRACATSSMTAVEASRVRTVVRARRQHDRHRVPSTMPARIRAGEVLQLLGQHVAGLEIGHEQDVGLPGHRRDDRLGARRFQRDRVVERERPVEHAAGDLAAIGHLAQRRRVERAEGSSGSPSPPPTGSRPSARAMPSTCARSIAFWQMSTFVSQVRVRC